MQSHGEIFQTEKVLSFRFCFRACHYRTVTLISSKNKPKDGLLHGIHSSILLNKMTVGCHSLTGKYYLSQGKRVLVDIGDNTPSIVLIPMKHPIEIKCICIKSSQFLFPLYWTSANWHVKAGFDYVAYEVNWFVSRHKMSCLEEWYRGI